MYHKYTIEEFATDPSFRQWVLNPNRESNMYWEKWIKNHPECLPTIKKAHKLVRMEWMPRERLSEPEIEELWEEIEAVMQETDEDEESQVVPINYHSVLNRPQYSHSSSRGFQYWYRIGIGIAAAIAIIMMVYYTLAPRQEFKLTDPLIVKENQRGQKLTIYLSDSSRVILNAESRVSYREGFTNYERKIKLDGEAYFIVARDTNRPFIVETSGLSVKALGTAFNVRSFEYEDDIQVGLVEGKVAVASQSPDELSNPVILDRGEAVHFNKTDKSLRKEKFDIYATTAWKDGVLVFKKASESEVLNKLSQWYDVDFNVVNDPGTTWDYTADFERQSLQSVLTSIGYTMNFEYEMDGRNVIIKYLPYDQM